MSKSLLVVGLGGVPTKRHLASIAANLGCDVRILASLADVVPRWIAERFHVEKTDFSEWDAIMKSATLLNSGGTPSGVVTVCEELTDVACRLAQIYSGDEK